MGLNTNLTNRKPSIAGVAIDVVSGQEIADLAVSNVVTISTNTAFILKADTITLPQTFVIENGAELSFVGHLGYPTTLICTTTGILISGSGSIKISDCIVVSTQSEAQIFDIADGIHVIKNFAFVGWGVAGDMDESILSFGLGQFIGLGDGFAFEDSTVVMGDVLVTSPGMGSTFIDIPKQNDTTSITLDAVSGGTLSEGLIRIDPDIDDDTTVNIRNCPLWGTLYNTSLGAATGTFTAVSDSFLSTIDITSITDNGGVARFHFTGVNVFQGQTIVISGYTTNTAYNGVGRITASNTTSYFEIEDVAFGSDEALGVFDSSSVTLTDTATPLADGDTLIISGDGSTDYDGGFVVYNKLTNSFQIDGLFVATESGTWNTAGITQKDPRVLSSNNPGFVNSKYIATAFVNDNATQNGTIVNGVFTDMVFGTTNTALTAASTIERWKLIDEVDGTFEYTGNEPFDGFITFDFTVESAGGNQDFKFKWLIDTGAGFNDLTDIVIGLVNVGSTAHSITKTFPLVANKGDKIKPVITRVAGTSGIITTYASMYASQ